MIFGDPLILKTATLQLSKMKTTPEFEKALKNESPHYRFLAIYHMMNKKQGSPALLIPLLKDKEIFVRQQAREALIILSKKKVDFGPCLDASPKQIDEAVTRWKAWDEKATTLSSAVRGSK